MCKPQPRYGGLCVSQVYAPLHTSSSASFSSSFCPPRKHIAARGRRMQCSSAHVHLFIGMHGAHRCHTKAPHAKTYILCASCQTIVKFAKFCGHFWHERTEYFVGNVGAIIAGASMSRRVE